MAAAAKGGVGGGTGRSGKTPVYEYAPEYRDALGWRFEAGVAIVVVVMVGPEGPLLMVVVVVNRPGA